MTTVVNMRTDKCDVRIDRTSIFGNPFKIGRDGDREEVIEKYKERFRIRLGFEPGFRGKVEKLRGKRLGCWCRPKDGFQGAILCHGQIIAGYLDGLPPESIL